MKKEKDLSIRRLNQAAHILSSFDFRAAEYCDVMVYYSSKNGEVAGSSINSISDGDHFKKWKKREWRDFIIRKAHDYVNFFNSQPFEVASIVIVFKVKDSFSEPLYHIEMTDLFSGRFDRLLISDPYSDLKEINCTVKESSRISGATDVVKLAKKVPQVRTRRVPSDLALAALESRPNASPRLWPLAR